MTHARHLSVIGASIGFALANLGACQRESTPPPSVAAPANTAAPGAGSPATQIPPSAADGYSIPVPAAATDTPSAPAIAQAVEFAVPRTVAAGKGGDVTFTITKMTTSRAIRKQCRWCCWCGC